MLGFYTADIEMGGAVTMGIGGFALILLAGVQSLQTRGKPASRRGAKHDQSKRGRRTASAATASTAGTAGNAKPKEGTRSPGKKPTGGAKKKKGGGSGYGRVSACEDGEEVV